MSDESLLAVAGILVGAGCAVNLVDALAAGRLSVLAALVAFAVVNWLMAATVATAFD